MDNQIVESDNDDFDVDFEMIDPSPVVTQNQNEVFGIESWHTCFMKRYNACPAFYMGSLQDACEAAFNATVIKDRRPVLVYIHNDKSLFNNIFCLKILCSESVIGYLLENYIVWPWDVTCESNINELMKFWEEIFDTRLFDHFSAQQCPLLIGIMPRSEKEMDEPLISIYKFKLLMKDYTLTSTEQKSTCETILNELIVYKGEFDNNKPAPLFDFVNNTGLCWDVFLEIMKYFSLNEIINAFSTNILPALHYYKTKVHLFDDNASLIKIINQNLNPEQIVSLRLNPEKFYQKLNLDPLTIFINIISLTLFNAQHTLVIKNYTQYFPNLTSLSLWYDSQIRFDRFLPDIIYQRETQIKRLYIRCDKLRCNWHHTHRFTNTYKENCAIQYFLLDVSHFPLAMVNNCCRNEKFCSLMVIVDFIRHLPNVRYVRVLTNLNIIEELLHVNEWKIVVNEFHLLKKVTFEVLGSLIQDQEIIQKVLEIEKELRDERQTIKFQVKFSFTRIK